MRRLGLILAFLFTVATPLRAATVTLAWDANPETVAGYRVFYGESAGLEVIPVDAGTALSIGVSNLIPGVQYFFLVRAYDSAGRISPDSNEVAYTVPVIPPNDPCAFPLGATSVSIFITGKLNKTGSGGPGSKAFIMFQAASPNSPVTFLSVRANGVDLLDSITQGSNLHAPGSLWFTLPTGPATFSVFARNAANCARDQPTGFAVGAP